MSADYTSVIERTRGKGSVEINILELPVEMLLITFQRLWEGVSAMWLSLIRALFEKSAGGDGIIVRIGIYRRRSDRHPLMRKYLE